jgi:hypothetical protein
MHLIILLTYLLRTDIRVPVAEVHNGVQVHGRGPVPPGDLGPLRGISPRFPRKRVEATRFFLPAHDVNDVALRPEINQINDRWHLQL